MRFLPKWFGRHSPAKLSSALKTRWEASGISARSLRSDIYGPRESTLLGTQQNQGQRRQTTSDAAYREVTNRLVRSESSETEASGAHEGCGEQIEIGKNPAERTWRCDYVHWRARKKNLQKLQWTLIRRENLWRARRSGREASRQRAQGGNFVCRGREAGYWIESECR